MPVEFSPDLILYNGKVVTVDPHSRSTKRWRCMAASSSRSAAAPRSGAWPASAPRWALVDEARRSFREEIGDVAYQPLLPGGQRPPLDLNRTLMDRYRPQMEAHYIREKPIFV